MIDIIHHKESKISSNFNIWQSRKNRELKSRDQCFQIWVTAVIRKIHGLPKEQRFSGLRRMLAPCPQTGKDSNYSPKDVSGALDATATLPLKVQVPPTHPNLHFRISTPPKWNFITFIVLNPFQTITVIILRLFSLKII